MKNASALSPSERNRLIGILARLASDFDGERAAAGLLATRLLRDRGLSWDDLISRVEDRKAWPGAARPGAGNAAGPGPATSWHANLGTCLRHLPALSAWEADFVLSLSTQRKALTPGQAAKLAQITVELQARGFV